MKKRKKKLTEVYCGKKSKDFWKTVNSLPEKYWEQCYSLGCALQDLEGRTIRAINRAIQEL